MNTTTQKIYTQTVIGRMRRGWHQGLATLRRVISQIPAHMVSSLFYLSLGQTLLYLHLTEEADVMFGLRLVGWIPWQVVVSSFVLCGWVLAQSRTVEVYVACHVPAGLYALLLLWGLAMGDIGALGLLPAIYLMFAVVAMTLSVAEQERIRLLKRQVMDLEAGLEEVQRWRRSKGDLSDT